MTVEVLEDLETQQEFLTVIETAELLRISVPTVYRLLYADKIPALRVGGQYRIPRDDLIATLRASREDNS